MTCFRSVFWRILGQKKAFRDYLTFNESLFTIQRLLTISRFHCSTWDIQLWSQSYLCLPSLYYHNIFDQISMINQDWFRIFLFGANSKAKINFIRRLSAARAQYTLAILAKCKCTANISTAQYTVLFCVLNTSTLVSLFSTDYSQTCIFLN